MKNDERRVYLLDDNSSEVVKAVVTRICSLKTKVEINKYWKTALNELIETILVTTTKGLKKNYIKHKQVQDTILYYNINRLTKLITVVRGEIRAQAGNKKVRDWLLSSGQKTKGSDGKIFYRGIVNVPMSLSIKREKNKGEKLEGRRVVLKKINNLDLIYITCLDYLSSPLWYKKAIAISFFTGRRFAEIMKSGKLTETRVLNVVNFRGQLKKKPGTKDAPYKIPVLHAKKVIQALKELRELKDLSNVHPDKVNNYQKTVNTHIKKDFGVDMSSHKLRSLYALYMDHYQCDGASHRTRYIGAILGHSSEEGKLNASSSKYELLDVEFNLPANVASQLADIEYSL